MYSKSRCWDHIGKQDVCFIQLHGVWQHPFDVIFHIHVVNMHRAPPLDRREHKSLSLQRFLLHWDHLWNWKFLLWAWIPNHYFWCWNCLLASLVNLANLAGLANMVGLSGRASLAHLASLAKLASLVCLPGIADLASLVIWLIWLVQIFPSKLLKDCKNGLQENISLNLNLNLSPLFLNLKLKIYVKAKLVGELDFLNVY